LDLADVLATLDEENGHVLYYRGEVNRVLKDRIAMRGYLWNYLQGADHHNAEAFDGDAAKCYSRTSGYCKERTAWVNHLIANDYYDEAQGLGDGKTVTSLRGALKYEKYNLGIRPSGFERIGSIESSCDLLHGIATELDRSGQQEPEVQSTLNQYCTP
jgi:hypothetical protein